MYGAGDQDAFSPTYGESAVAENGAKTEVQDLKIASHDAESVQSTAENITTFAYSEKDVSVSKVTDHRVLSRSLSHINDGMHSNQCKFGSVFAPEQDLSSRYYSNPADDGRCIRNC